MQAMHIQTRSHKHLRLKRITQVVPWRARAKDQVLSGFITQSKNCAYRLCAYNESNNQNLSTVWKWRSSTSYWKTHFVREFLKREFHVHNWKLANYINVFWMWAAPSASKDLIVSAQASCGLVENFVLVMPYFEIFVIGYGYESGIWRQWCLKSVLAYRQSKDHLCNLVCCPNIEWRLMVQVKEPNVSKRTPPMTISVCSSEPQKTLGFLFAAALNSILRCCKEASEISQISLATLCQGNLLGLTPCTNILSLQVLWTIQWF